MTALETLIARYHDPRIQMSRAQISIIASIISAQRPTRLLVFGLGYDSALWRGLNEGGETLFVESDPLWADRIAGSVPASAVLQVDFAAHGSVGDAISTPWSRLAALPLPSRLQQSWDIILVDGPAGYHLTDPGRAVPLVWAAQLAIRATHVFVDDYNRPVERHFADLGLRRDETPCLVIPHENSAVKSMLWRVGRAL